MNKIALQSCGKSLENKDFPLVCVVWTCSIALLPYFLNAQSLAIKAGKVFSIDCTIKNNDSASYKS